MFFSSLKSVSTPFMRPRCALCQLYDVLDSDPLCEGCRADLTWRGSLVKIQEMSIQIAFAYQWPIDRLIHLYKYQARLELLPIFAYGLMQLQRPEVDALLAVPLSSARLCERGFNQSHELAKQMADHWNIPLLSGIRRCDGLRQKGLNRDERLQNLENAFVSDQETPRLPQRIALIDDVLTTGSTLLSLATYLRSQGVAEVIGLVIASQHQYRANTSCDMLHNDV